MTKIPIHKHSSRKHRAIKVTGKVVRLGIHAGFKAKLIKPSPLRTRALITHKGRVLLVRGAASRRGYWSLPGGGIKKNEAPLDAMVREVNEELSLEISSAEWRELATFSKSEVNARYGVICYTHDISSAEKHRIKLSPELLDAEWFDLDRMPSSHTRLVGLAIKKLRQ